MKAVIKGICTLTLLNMSMADALKVEAQAKSKAESKAEYYMGQPQ